MFSRDIEVLTLGDNPLFSEIEFKTILIKHGKHFVQFT